MADPMDNLRLGRAVRDTQQTVQGASDRVESLRHELGGRIEQLDTKVDELAIVSANVEGKVDVLLEEFKVASRERSQIRVSAVQATIEVEKTGELAAINEAADQRRARRDMVVRVLSPIIAALIGLLVGRC